MPRTNRIDPYGDLHADSARGLFTGNRGCLLNNRRQLVRHHAGTRWITCQTTFRDWNHPLDEPGVWTPLFFLDEAVALAAGHRPCALCRRKDYNAYRNAIAAATGTEAPLPATDLDDILHGERLRPGVGVLREHDRILWPAQLDDLPVGTVIIEASSGAPHLITPDGARRFGFAGWHPPTTINEPTVQVLTPPTSVAALKHGYTPTLHPTAQ